MDTDLLEVKSLIMKNEVGCAVRMYQMGPFLIDNLVAFRDRLELALTFPHIDVRYMTQDRDGYIGTSHVMLGYAQNSDKWCQSAKGSQHTMQGAFPGHHVASFIPRKGSKELSYVGISNESWKKAIVPRPFLLLALEAIERWYRKMDTSGGTQLTHTPYSIAMRMYAHKKKMKSISKGESNGSE